MTKTTRSMVSKAPPITPASIIKSIPVVEALGVILGVDNVLEKTLAFLVLNVVTAL